MTKRQKAGGLLVLGGVLCLSGVFLSRSSIELPQFLSFLRPKQVSKGFDGSGDIRWVQASQGYYLNISVHNDYSIAKSDEFIPLDITLERKQAMRFEVSHRWQAKPYSVGPYYVRCGEKVFTINQTLSAEDGGDRYYQI